jgi:hypothetical protein
MGGSEGVYHHGEKSPISTPCTKHSLLIGLGWNLDLRVERAVTAGDAGWPKIYIGLSKIMRTDAIRQMAEIVRNILDRRNVYDNWNKREFSKPKLSILRMHVFTLYITESTMCPIYKDL